MKWILRSTAASVHIVAFLLAAYQTEWAFQDTCGGGFAMFLWIPGILLAAGLGQLVHWLNIAIPEDGSNRWIALVIVGLLNLPFFAIAAVVTDRTITRTFAGLRPDRPPEPDPSSSGPG